MASFQDKNCAKAGSSEDAEITQLVRDGVRPKNLKGRLNLAVDKFLGNVPLGVDAPNKTIRKVIGGAWELLHVLKYGFFGAFLSLAGIAILYVSLSNEPSLKGSAVGAGLLVLGVWCLRSAYKANRALRAISKA